MAIKNFNMKLKETLKLPTRVLDKKIEKATKILLSKTFERFFVCYLRKSIKVKIDET